MDAAKLFFTFNAASRGDGKRQIKNLTVNGWNDSIHPFTNGHRKIAGSVIFPCWLQASEHGLLLVSNSLHLHAFLYRITFCCLLKTSFSFPSNTITPSSSKSLQFRFLCNQPCLPHQPRSKILYKGKICLLLSSIFSLHLSSLFLKYFASNTFCCLHALRHLSLIITPPKHSASN